MEGGKKVAEDEEKRKTFEDQPFYGVFTEDPFCFRERILPIVPFKIARFRTRFFSCLGDNIALFS